MPCFEMPAPSVILFACLVAGGDALYAQTRPCENAIAALVAAGATIERGVIPPAGERPPGVGPEEHEEDGSDPCRNVTEVKFWRIERQEAVIASLPHVAALDRPDAITLDLDRVDPAYFDDLAEQAEALGKVKAIELWSKWNEPLVNDDLVHLSKLPNLELLSLTTSDGEGISDDGLVHLKGLRRLRWLNLRGSRITDAGLSHLRELDSLESLLADNTELTGEGLPHLEGTPIKMLHAMETKIDDEGLANLGRLERLTYLSLAHCPIDGTGFPHLAPLRNLRQLDLSDTSVDDTTLATLPKSVNLTTLRLARTRIGDASIDSLIGRTTLLNVDLHETKVTEEGLRRLRAANPRLRIRF